MSRSIDPPDHWSNPQGLGQTLLAPQFRVDISRHDLFRFPRPWAKKRWRHTYIASTRLPDGTVVETIDHPRIADQTCFLVARGGQSGVTNWIPTPDGILLPLLRTNEFLRNVALPDGLRPYGSRETLKRNIGAFLNSRYPLSEDLQDRLSGHVSDTWTFDCRSFSPIMILVAPLSISLPLIEALSQVCMRALRVGTGTIDGMIRARSELCGTLIVSGGFSSSRTLELLAQSTRAGVVALGSGGATSLYGPTILATPRVPDDSDLLSDAIVIPLPWAERTPAAVDATEAGLRARELRNQQLQLRLDFIRTAESWSREISPDCSPGARELPAALTPPCSADRALCERSVIAAPASARPASAGVPRPYKAVISAALFYYHEYIGSPIVKVDRLLSSRQLPSWTHAAKWLEYPDLQILTKLARGPLCGWGNKAPLTENEVGHILADVGLAGLGPKGSAFQLALTDEVVRTLHQLARFCGVVPLDVDAQASLDYHLCPFCREVGFVSKMRLQSFEEIDVPRIREAERREAEESARDIAKFEQAGGLLGKISGTHGGEAGEGAQEGTAIPNLRPRPQRVRTHDKSFLRNGWKEARTDGRKIPISRSATRRSQS